MDLLLDRPNLTLVSVTHRLELEPITRARLCWRGAATEPSWCATSIRRVSHCDGRSGAGCAAPDVLRNRPRLARDSHSSEATGGRYRVSH